jgi:hypothetical protein
LSGAFSSWPLKLISADKVSRKLAEYALRSVPRCHERCETGLRTRGFRSFVAELQTQKDSMAERSEFELPVPLSKLSDDSVVL